MILSRRLLLACALGGASARAATLGDDGMYHEPWFVESFLDLPDDLEAAATANQRLVAAWELRGCPACRRVHLENFSRADIVDYLRPRFAFVQLDIIGARVVTALDGARLAEKALAGREKINGTPTFQVFDRKGKELDRMEGFVPADRFLAFFRRLATDE